MNYYHRNYGVTDKDPGEPHLNHFPEDEELHKIQVGWNSGLENWSLYGIYLSQLRRSLPTPRFYPRTCYPPSTTRPLIFSCRVGTNYSRETVAFQRKEVSRRLQKWVPGCKISCRKYFQ